MFFWLFIRKLDMSEWGQYVDSCKCNCPLDVNILFSFFHLYLTNILFFIAFFLLTNIILHLFA